MKTKLHFPKRAGAQRELSSANLTRTPRRASQHTALKAGTPASASLTALHSRAPRHCHVPGFQARVLTPCLRPAQPSLTNAFSDYWAAGVSSRPHALRPGSVSCTGPSCGTHSHRDLQSLPIT